MEEALKLLRENNQMLKEILAITRKFDSKEFIEANDNKALAINLVADLAVEIWADRFKSKNNNI